MSAYGGVKDHIKHFTYVKSYSAKGSVVKILILQSEETESQRGCTDRNQALDLWVIFPSDSLVLGCFSIDHFPLHAAIPYIGAFFPPALWSPCLILIFLVRLLKV